MLTVPGLALSACGFFLFLWYRTLVSLPSAVRPAWAGAAAFKWGVPALALILFSAGIALLAARDVRLSLFVLAAAAAAGFAMLRFDRHTAVMRIIHDQYRTIRAARPDLDETGILYLTARWRYPNWTDDRLAELVAGKSIESLMLLIVLEENKVNPISDWELYRHLRQNASRVAGPRKQ
jgi:hypothetical protein